MMMASAWLTTSLGDCYSQLEITIPKWVGNTLQSHRASWYINMGLRQKTVIFTRGFASACGHYPQEIPKMSEGFAGNVELNGMI